MPEKEDKKNKVTRKNFFKKAGAAVAGTTAATVLPFGAKNNFFPGALAEQSPAVRNNYKCPIDGKEFESFSELKKHFREAHPQADAPVLTTLKVNGKIYEVQIEPNWTLQKTLQFKLGLTGAKTKCDRGVCGSCTVIIDGRAVLSCITLAVECEGKSIETIEGIAENKKWKPLIDSYCKHEAMQCGYCTPGFIVSAKNLLDKNRKPKVEEIEQALAGNLCSCGTYPHHTKAILEAAEEI